MANVILDTNALLYPFSYSIDIECELVELLGKCTIFVPEVVLNELNALARSGKREAMAAIRFSQRFKIFPEIHGLRGDDGVLAATSELEGVLVTSDKELMGRAKKMGLIVAFLRGKKKLELK